MNPISNLVRGLSKQAREGRAQIFRNSFQLDPATRILDFGSETGSNIHLVLQGTAVRAENVYIADIDPVAVNKGSKKFGFVPVIIRESDQLPFEDGFFDIVFCSSVIEHVTVPKNEVWHIYSGRVFKSKSYVRQKEFADEIRRLGKQYFVQTPYKHFPIDSHTWLPLTAWLPRLALILVLRFTNLFWVKKAKPDWNLLDKRQMRELFAGAEIIYEKKFGLTKSIMAIKTANDSAGAASIDQQA
jgi:SAM-dependent methyltransferase